jgi:peptidoglycan/xylan/chitin deacetylase (PgdA/CDA1 family)
MKRIGLIRTFFEIFLIIVVIILAITVHKEKIQRASNYSWYQNVVHSVPTNEKVVALTYDDGPHPVYTRQILDILDKYHVKATFFMIGRLMEQYPDIVNDVLKRGHVIANHTYTHPGNIESDTSAQVIRELEQCEQVIERMTGRRANFFRPPRGLIDSTVFSIAQDEGYQTILWTVSADHHDAPTPELMAQRVLKLNRPGGIILAHDGTFPTRWKDVAATPLIIEGLKKQGYRFVTIPELLKIGAKHQFTRDSLKHF